MKGLRGRVAGCAAGTTTLDFRALAESARTVAELFPVMRDATIVRCWAGLEGFVDDGLPVIGPGTGEPGIYHAFGFSTHGFQLGPAHRVAIREPKVTNPTNSARRTWDFRRGRRHGFTVEALSLKQSPEPEQTFEEVYPKYPFAELVRLSVRFAKLLTRLRRRQSRKRPHTLPSDRRPALPDARPHPLATMGGGRPCKAIC
ncbi:MAG: FAD-dependent oxidoreductase [Rhodospirillales bacterium]|nr:FAD-dependent oxidoreductase [Rhodospirillales bacterium]